MWPLKTMSTLNSSPLLCPSDLGSANRLSRLSRSCEVSRRYSMELRVEADAEAVLEAASGPQIKAMSCPMQEPKKSLSRSRSGSHVRIGWTELDRSMDRGLEVGSQRQCCFVFTLWMSKLLTWTGTEYLEPYRIA